MAALLFYAIIIAFIFLQNRILLQTERSAETIIFINNIELLLFFAGYYFFFGGHRVFLTTFAPFGQTAALLFSLILYFGGLAICHLSLQRNGGNLFSGNSPVRFMMPFAIPFVLFTFLSEIEALSIKDDTTLEITTILILNFAVIILAIVFVPPLAVQMWNCPRLNNPSLTAELDTVCHKANFSHSGFRIWNVMRDSCTAAIIGVIGRFRYILFTQKLLDVLPVPALKAVLAHEIGHSRRHHLLIYPFVFLGMAVLGSLALIPLYAVINASDQNSAPELQAIEQLISFVVFAAVVGLYFRYVFGYFSRAFERQADLYIFELGIPAKDMVEALDTLGTISGNIHNKPNWHHHSISERIDFLQKAEQKPQLIRRHHRLVYISLGLYSIFLIPFFIYLVAQIIHLS